MYGIQSDPGTGYSPSASVSPEGTRWRSWLRHCAKSRKFVGSIPNVVF
jgi:hypothetical protein